MKSEVVKAGRYSLMRQLGEGSQGETFEARDNGLVAPSEDLGAAWNTYVARAKGASEPSRGTVAVKRFRLARAKEWKDVELAEREAKTLAALHHPSLPKYVEHFEEDGALYLVMEMIEGESLSSIRARGGRFDIDDVTRMLEDLGGALRYLHTQAPPIVHRDIKPGNVIRRPDGSFALVDFGSVRDRLKPAGGSTVVGTFGYMAPEQFQGRAVPQSDVYGVGATALAMLTGQEPEALPHRGLAIDVEHAVPRRTPKHLVRALTAMLEPDPDRRAATVEDALEALKQKRPRRRSRRKEAKRSKNSEVRAIEVRERGDRRPRAFWIVLATAVLVGAVMLPLLITRALDSVQTVALGIVTLVLARALRRRWMGRSESRPRIAAGAETPKLRVAEPSAAKADAEVDADVDAEEEEEKREDGKTGRIS